MFPHQIPLTFPSHQNAVSEHYYSSSEGSEAHSLGHPPPRDAFLSDGSPDSRVAPPTDEPYLPPRSQDQTMGHPSPLTYSLPPDNSFPHNLTPPSRHRAYPSEYTHHGYDNGYLHDYSRLSYSSRQPEVLNDTPYIPPNYAAPPPLALQAQRHFNYAQQASYAAQPHPPRPVIAPTYQRDLPSSPSSEGSDISLAQGHYTPVLQHSHSPSLPPVSMELRVSAGPEPSSPPTHVNQSELPQSRRSEPPAEQPERSHQWHETDRYLRNQIGIPEGTDVDLWALPDPPAGQKPQQPLPILVKLAIHGSVKGRLTLQEIYQSLEDRFTYFARLRSSAWKNSIRHNLSLNQVFRSCDRPITEPGKGRYWSVDISKGEGYKRERRRKRRNAAPYNGTRDLPGGIGNQLANQVDSSDGDQDMDDGASSSLSLKAKKGKSTRRGPYTRLTLGQPSIPGTTGITVGGASGAASISPVGGTPPVGTPPSSSAPLGEMSFPTSVPVGSAPPPPQQPQTSSSSALSHHPHNRHHSLHPSPHVTTVTTSTNPQSMISSSSAIGATATGSSSSTSYLAQPPYYHSHQHQSTTTPPTQTPTSYFGHNHAVGRPSTLPTFGQPSFPSPSNMYGSGGARFGPGPQQHQQQQQSSSSYMHNATRRVGRSGADAISVSSDSSGSPERDRMSM
ncbi:hypothetical protein AGABI1DRAFT_107749 [Agaricus bisporus var. burnettii JB137-S8]|uniref:Fork-head domain-containing protein n=1 Tax=Agaricus bisporus var. burnettii (strain JB137-S8 / ATCC MYA-4627 / FGSC 10392) TaxID=597362 RepID=K5WRE9_AGABU|nr:uncharacterized protein AGABI1DRAFT_107749 [Agaricus bisporus var. burnettii JB137-S8]EKM77971.1 hypothetical protein AGABI1DRAFT_107749 [Agaricus bisporus var. burnettii JB137-S8]